MQDIDEIGGIIELSFISMTYVIYVHCANNGHRALLHWTERDIRDMSIFIRTLT